jgi:integrative and conjugative element protein (TIGR02256 family)
MLYNNLGNGTILFIPEALDTFSKYQQTGSMPEAGGYLIGREFGRQLVVEIATEPGTRDIRKPFFFKRNKYRGQRIVEKIWEASGKKMIIAGEWHSHPERFPVPSEMDIREAMKSFDKGHFPLGFMLIVIVSKSAIVHSWVGIQTKAGLYQINRIGYQLWRDD